MPKPSAIAVNRIGAALLVVLLLLLLALAALLSWKMPALDVQVGLASSTRPCVRVVS